MPAASDFTRMRKMIARANVFVPTSPAMWVPRLPIVLPNIIHSNKFTRPVFSDELGSWFQGGDPFSSVSNVLFGGTPFESSGKLLSGGFP